MNDSWWLPPVVSEHGPKVDALWNIITVITGVAFVGVEGLLVWFCLKYKKQADGRRALYTHGSHRLEVWWTLIPFVILVALGVGSNTVWANIKTDPPAPGDVGAELKVVAQRFSWNVYYPGPDGVLDTADDVFRDRQLVIPADETVMVRLTSKDVLHSFFVPYARVKQDAVPGYVGRVWFEITTPTDPGADGKWVTVDDIPTAQERLDARHGIWTRKGTDPETGEPLPWPLDLACAELCGDSHYNMNGTVYVLPRPAYDEWLRATYAAAAR